MSTSKLRLFQGILSTGWTLTLQFVQLSINSSQSFFGKNIQNSYSYLKKQPHNMMYPIDCYYSRLLVKYITYQLTILPHLLFCLISYPFIEICDIANFPLHINLPDSAISNCQIFVHNHSNTLEHYDKRFLHGYVVVQINTQLTMCL